MALPCAAETGSACVGSVGCACHGLRCAAVLIGSKQWLDAGSLHAAQCRTGEAVAAFGSAAVYALAKAVRKWLSCAMYAWNVFLQAATVSKESHEASV